MTEEQRRLFDEFSKKVQFVKEQLREKISEIEELKKAFEDAGTELKDVIAENQKLKYENNVLKVSRSLDQTDGGDGFTKKRIGELVREIDKCIELLNE